ncbi:glycosyltransferase [Gabonibacter massiliensis]|uniref:glycosyltransferase n=1 Tax=Gabonibacter massiliensis TaxID=1720195 RepID=UPI00073F11D0|nr:glycosyltransferase [Gabonibacter massiliensis]
MRKIKICHLTSVHSAKDVRIFVKECRSLAFAGYEVTLIAPNAFNEVVDGVSIVGVNISYANRLYRIFKASNIVFSKALEIDADIYHIHDPELLPYGVKLKKIGKKVIFDSHEDVPKQILNRRWLPILFRNIVSFAYKIYEKKCLKIFDAVISVNNTIVDRLKKINKNTVCVTNFPCLTEYVSNHDINKEQAICFAGSISPVYMHHIILDALEELEDVKYLLAGAVDRDYMTILQKKSAWRKVEYLGYVNRKQVYDMYDRSIAGVAILDFIPSIGGKKGGIGFIKNFEFMMAGLPIICTDFEEWREIIEKYNCGICVNPTNKKEISDAISFLLKNPDTAKLMGQNGRRAVEEKYNWGTQEIVLLKLYDNLSRDMIG